MRASFERHSEYCYDNEVYSKRTVGGEQMQRNAKLLWALFLLRLGLGLFLLLWGLDKIIAPEIAVMVFSRFYYVDIGISAAMLIGALEIVLSLLMILGFYRTITYGLGLLVHTISTLSTLRELLSPFGPNHLFIAGIPILFAFLTLFLLRDFDTLWTLGKRKSLFAK